MRQINRIILWFQIYSLDITIEGQTKCLALVKDPTHNLCITLARQKTKRERTRLRSEYNATFAPGRRSVWTVA